MLCWAWAALCGIVLVLYEDKWEINASAKATINDNGK